MKKRYGDKEGERVFYATANKQGRVPETWQKKEAMLGRLAKAAQAYRVAGTPEAAVRAALSPLSIPHASLSHEFDPDDKRSLGMRKRVNDPVYVDDDELEHVQFVANLPPKLRKRLMKEIGQKGSKDGLLKSMIYPANLSRRLMGVAYTDRVSGLPAFTDDTSNIERGLTQGDDPSFVDKWLYPTIAKGHTRGAAIKRHDPRLARDILAHMARKRKGRGK